MSELTDQVTDPVCGMSVAPAMAMTSTVVSGETYYFCSEDCYRTFMKNPAAYVS
jgi:Cu+-exporting ATPase